MKHLPRPTPVTLLLLALAALLVFGNCGGGVQGFLTNLGNARRARLRAIIVRERVQRSAARQLLRGRARRTEYDRIRTTTTASLDSLFRQDYYGSERTKFARRRSKIERQLFRPSAAGTLVQPIRWPMPNMH